MHLNLYHSLAALGPALGAVVTSRIYYGSAGVYKLLTRVQVRRPASSSWWFTLSPLYLFAFGLFIYRIVKGSWFDFHLFYEAHWSGPDVLLAWLLPLLAYSIFEEIGWRGFLLPHLQQKHNAWKSVIYMTIIWAVWHIPFFFYRFDFSVFISIGFFFGMFVGAVLLTSIYNSSKGFLIPVILYHFLMNLCSGFDTEFIVSVLSTGYVLMAIYIYFTYGRADLSPYPRVQNYLKHAP